MNIKTSSAYRRFGLLATSLSLLLITGCGKTEQEPSQTNASNAQVNASQSDTAKSVRYDNWALHGNSAKEQRFSTLAQITPDNIEQMGVAWHTDIKSRSLRGVEATPIVIDGVMYVSGPWSVVMALNAVTGEELWHYDPKVPGDTARKACCDVVNRGVAVANDTVIFGTLDGRLIALDKNTGEESWVNNTVDPTQSYTITGAPRIVGNKVVIGNGGAEYGVRGYVTAYDIESGKQSWRFYTVPGNPEDGHESPAMEMAAKTWTGKWWELGGGGTAWDSMAYDEDLDLLYIGTGNGSPWNISIRSPQGGDNLFLSSIVAVRPDTGEYVWHFQTTPEEQWDYTATQHMILAELDIDGRSRKVIMQAPKNGFFYVLDRETGEFISGENYVPVSWATGLDAKTGRPNIVDQARYSTTGTPFLGTPSPGGGHNWHPMSFNPNTGLVYFSAMEMPYGYVAKNAAEFEFNPRGWNTGEDAAKFSMPEDPQIRAQIRSMMKGKLLAWNPVTQKEAWSVSMGTPWNGGTLTTASNLVFHGNGEGYLAAYKADTGEKVWQHYVSTGIVAAPVSYAVDGKQYISIATGWGGILPLNLGEPLQNGVPPHVNRVVTFAIGADLELPTSTVAAVTLDPPELTATTEQVDQGRVLYNENCWMCHGDTAVNNGGIPNLRYSRTLANADAFGAFVFNGVAETRGMPNFTESISKSELEAIRAYVIKRANDLKANPGMP